ncbi:MAG: hypothetical protein SPM09_04685 [Fibrobacter sp.]|uniref:hypothetical protein n=1 Tax=Fibrobacter sp. TaxID=35828 RepID=UPI002A919D09|nr:hypothetical protein [Fibrobacter sp.]MDY6263687.1 hypothetical protein [Fibrobacter sp.]
MLLMDPVTTSWFQDDAKGTVILERSDGIQDDAKGTVILERSDGIQDDAVGNL